MKDPMPKIVKTHPLWVTAEELVMITSRLVITAAAVRNGKPDSEIVEQVKKMSRYLGSLSNKLDEAWDVLLPGMSRP